MTAPHGNLAQSVHDRLLKLSKARGEDFNFLLVRYALERLLYRLSQSAHEKDFILKGVLKAYRRETVVAEKLHALVELGTANTRMKDFFDLWFLSREFEFDGGPLALAIGKTFERRQSPLPDSVPIGLTEAFGFDELKTKQWRAFLSRSGATHVTIALPELMAEVRPFLMPAIHAARTGAPFALVWKGRRWVSH